MPFVSEAQRKYMHKNHPEIAKKWEEHTSAASLPERVKPKKPAGPDPNLVKALERLRNGKR